MQNMRLGYDMAKRLTQSNGAAMWKQVGDVYLAPNMTEVSRAKAKLAEPNGGCWSPFSRSGKAREFCWQSCCAPNALHTLKQLQNVPKRY